MSESDNEENAIPVLKDVVTPGDESIIKTSRLGQEVIRDIEILEKKVSNLSPAELSRDLTEKHVDELIDEIISRHMTAMRAELKSVLAQIIVKSSGRS